MEARCKSFTLHENKATVCVAEETNNCKAARRFSVSEKLIRDWRKLRSAESGREHIGTPELSAGVCLQSF